MFSLQKTILEYGKRKLQSWETSLSICGLFCRQLKIQKFTNLQINILLATIIWTYKFALAYMFQMLPTLR